MPSIAYNYVVSCDWSRQTHDTDRANHSPSISCDQLCPITANHNKRLNESVSFSNNECKYQ
ncbi:unnamed protein product [Staurois parvus]|uniref:Uncharacterized protein n=1 Tax=Staurois parvus TaxID=386267 RepID=A0ABN9DNE6_9NEOB|nr:unnamed protein product [Staurois parvus]